MSLEALESYLTSLESGDPYTMRLAAIRNGLIEASAGDDWEEDEPFIEEPDF